MTGPPPVVEGRAIRGASAVLLPMSDGTSPSQGCDRSGPTAVINQSLVGAVLEAKKHPAIRQIYGALHGIQGILDENLINLKREPKSGLEAVAATPSSALGSVRRKPTAEDCAAIFRVLEKYGVRYFFYIGGNDSMDTAHKVAQLAAERGLELVSVGVPKTVDNDVGAGLMDDDQFGLIDHTPGYGSVARYWTLIRSVGR